MDVRVTVLGSGTSHGVPMIGCECATCRSADPRDKRTNASLLVSAGESRILLDCGRDFRVQALRQRLARLDALLLTHAHYDHVAGMDDLRVFTSRGRGSLPVYGPADHLQYVREHAFRYLFEGRTAHRGGGVASLDLRPVDGPFEVCGIEFRPIPVLHGNTEVFGYRFADCAYLPDVSRLPQAAVEALGGLRLLVIDGLRYRSHVSHLSVDEALSVVRGLAPRRALLTHICHDVLHADLEARLLRENGARVGVAYDGLEIEPDADAQPAQ